MEVSVEQFTRFMAAPAGRMLSGAFVFVYLTAAVHVAAPRSQVAQSPASAVAPDYRVGTGDRIFLSVPQRPDLNRELIVSEKGEVNLPLVGDVMVKGLAAAEIESRILQALREYYPSVNRVQVSITQAMGNVIYVSGDVKAPGKYNFPEAVNVWEAIREAGGPGPTASLNNVRIIQDRTRGGQSIAVNVQAVLDGGPMDTLPILRPGDTVLVPTREAMYTGAEGVNVIGAVIRPGMYRLEAREDLMSVILLAGGPTDRANLGEVRVIRPGASATKAETLTLTLKDFMDKGDMADNPAIRAGDTVAVPRKGFTSDDASLILGFISALGTMVLLYYTIQNEVQADQGIQ